MPVGDWAKSQRQAAPFAWSAASKGLSQAEGERQYRAGGGIIGHAAWRETFQAAFQIVGWRETLKTIPKHWQIPEHMFTQISYDYTDEFQLKHEVRWFDPSAKAWRQQPIQVGSDELLTRQDWEALVKEWLEDYLRRGQYDPDKGYKILEYEALRKG